MFGSRGTYRPRHGDFHTDILNEALASKDLPNILFFVCCLFLTVYLLPLLKNPTVDVYNIGWLEGQKTNSVSL